MVSIYILKLEQGKYYVGKSNNVNVRLASHFNSSGSEWTKKYKPIEIVEKIENCDNYDEDKYTLKYMNEYGVNNVRGGSFCQIELSDDNKKTIQQMLNGCNDKCYICGKKDHFAKDCNEKEGEWNFENIIKNIGNFLLDVINNFNKEQQQNVNNYKIKNKEQQTVNNKNIKKESQQSTNKEDQQPVNKGKCNKCGRFGHYANKCYAKSHINGTVINK